MSYFPDNHPIRLRPAIILSELAALAFGLSAIYFLSHATFIWVLGVMLILVHTLLFYRLGRLSERARSQSSSDFLRGLRQGLLRRPD